MNKQILLCASLAIMSLQACDKSDDESKFVSQQAKQALAEKYSDAKRVEWDVEGNYVVAEFSTNYSGEVSAWFDNSGKWYMTKTDILFSQLPEAVQTSFAAGEYAMWRVDDIDKVERQAAEPFYVIEVERQDFDVVLHYTSSGEVVKDIAGLYTYRNQLD